MKKPTRIELESELESLRARVALQDRVIDRLLATPLPTPVPVAPQMPPNTTWPIFPQTAPWPWPQYPIVTCGTVVPLTVDGGDAPLRTVDYRGVPVVSPEGASIQYLAVTGHRATH
jgi:hypothetical protein